MPTVYLVYARVLCPTTRELTIGGTQSYLIALGKAVAELGWDVRLIQFGDEDFEANLDGLSIQAYGISGKRRRSFRSLYDRFHGDLNAEDIIVWGQAELAPKVDSHTTVAIQHGISFDLVRDRSLEKWIRNVGLSSLHKGHQHRKAFKTISHSSHVVCVDYNFQNWYRTFSDRTQDDQLSVIPNFTSIPEWSVEPKQAFRKILFARRFSFERGSELMIACTKELLKRSSDLHVTFAGEGPFRSRIEFLRNEFPDHVAITRYQPSESLAFHRNYDIAVVPTLGSEGTSLSLLEAMAAGCSVVCSDVGGMTNIVIDRFNGRLVRPAIDTLTDAIWETISHPDVANRMRAVARDTVETSFSQALWNSRWQRLLQRLAQPAKDRRNIAD